MLGERAVRRLGVPQLRRHPPQLTDVSCGDDRLTRWLSRHGRDGGHERLAALSMLLHRLVELVAALDRLDNPAGVLLTEDLGQRTADDVARLLPVQRLGAGAPLGDRAVGTDAQNRVV